MAEVQKKRIYLWSHPRSYSSLLVRSFEQRNDTKTFLEPLLLNYNPDAEPVNEIISSVYQDLKKELQKPNDADITFVNEHLFGFECFLREKTIHTFDDNVMDDALHTFIIREPQESIHSYSAVLSGMKSQNFEYRENEVEIQNYEVLIAKLQKEKKKIIVINSTEMLKDPLKILQKYCDDCDIQFQDCMLQWEKAKPGSVYDQYREWFGTLADSVGFVPFNREKLQIAAVWSATCGKYQHAISKNLKVYNNLKSFYIKQD